ncbi:MAG: hypothetical protein IPL32_11735 [Chloracidobacterium sp.]|nr:hypothetical protein [Chloracidobacterium sp.]
MKLKALISLLLSFCFVVQPLAVSAMETDQYNLPPMPLADIGDEVSEYVEENLLAAVAKVNADIAVRQACIEVFQTKQSGCNSAEKEIKELAYLRSNDAVAKELYKLLGDGSIFYSHIGRWANKHKFRSHPATYKPNYLGSIYVAAPIDFVTLSPTVRLFGVEFGTDKLDHFFQQGYKYYEIQKEAASKGATLEQATTKAIKWGQRSERTYFGLLVSGVYSNADLYANYAGMKFYERLTEPFSIGNKTHPSVLILKDGKWTINVSNLREELLEPFVSDHLNEALNPSGYAFTIFGSVRRSIKKNACSEWRELFPIATKADLESRSASLENWDGEDYGHTRKGKSVSIAACFGV